jgi:hypothetical protein
MGSYRALVDIMGHDHLGGKTVLYLIDGLYSGNHNQDTIPHKWPVAPFNGGWTSSIFVSQDPVGLESVLFDLFQLDTDSYQYPKIPGAHDYLIEAASADNPPSGTFYDPNHATGVTKLPSLGVFERWNNPIDRKYSRNLGTGNGIELLFIDKNSSSPVYPTRKIADSHFAMQMIPEKNIIKISIAENGKYSLSVLNMQGRVVCAPVNFSLNSGDHLIKMSEIVGGSGRLASGPYIVSLLKNGEFRSRIVSQCTIRLFN